MQRRTQGILFSAMTAAAVLTGGAPALGAVVDGDALDGAAASDSSVSILVDGETVDGFERQLLLEKLAQQLSVDPTGLAEAWPLPWRLPEAESVADAGRGSWTDRVHWQALVTPESWRLQLSSGAGDEVPTDKPADADQVRPAAPRAAASAPAPPAASASAAALTVTAPLAAAGMRTEPETDGASADAPGTHRPLRAGTPEGTKPSTGATESYFAALPAASATAAPGFAMTAQPERIDPMAILGALGALCALGVLVLAAGQTASRSAALRRDLRVVFQNR
jgi:hypothetical protein